MKPTIFKSYCLGCTNIKAIFKNLSTVLNIFFIVNLLEVTPLSMKMSLYCYQKLSVFNVTS